MNKGTVAATENPHIAPIRPLAHAPMRTAGPRPDPVCPR